MTLIEPRLDHSRQTIDLSLGVSRMQTHSHPFLSLGNRRWHNRSNNESIFLTETRQLPWLRCAKGDNGRCGEVVYFEHD